jgi:hypothetical protein
MLKVPNKMAWNLCETALEQWRSILEEIMRITGTLIIIIIILLTIRPNDTCYR